jgi:transcriptional regulator with XRE-family HTH domain
MTKRVGYAKLKGFLVEHGIQQQEIADALGIDRSTFNSKLNRNNADFTLSEVRYLCRTYHLDFNTFFMV